MFVKRKLLKFVLLTTVLGSCLTTSGVLAQQSVSTPPTTAASIIQQIASLEVQRALLDATFTPESPYVQDVERNLRSLRQRFAQIQLNGNQSILSLAIKNAINGKIVELEAQRTRQSTRYSPDSPVMWQLNAQLRSLKKRLQSL